MYGLVNQGVHRFVIENFGEADWLELTEKAGVEETSFEGMLTYPDAITYQLVGAICEKYDIAAADALEKFGSYWVGFSRATAVGKLMRFGGQSLVDQLDSLNEMHARIKSNMPHLKPPHFELEELGEDHFVLHYATEREGLEAMVIGLVKGLADEAGAAISITQLPAPSYEGLSASFDLRILGDQEHAVT